MNYYRNFLISLWYSVHKTSFAITKYLFSLYVILWTHCFKKSCILVEKDNNTPSLEPALFNLREFNKTSDFNRCCPAQKCAVTGSQVCSGNFQICSIKILWSNRLIYIYLKNTYLIYVIDFAIRSSVIK